MQQQQKKEYTRAKKYAKGFKMIKVKIVESGKLKIQISVSVNEYKCVKELGRSQEQKYGSIYQT